MTKKNFPLLKEIFLYLWTNKQWWLIPAILLLVIVGVLVFVTQSSTMTPYVYALL